MKFRTEYEVRPAAELINPEESVVLVGSCFTDYIGDRMRLCRWRAYPNLTGTLFNPRSIANTLRIACRWEEVTAEVEDSIAVKSQLSTDEYQCVSWLADSHSTSYSRNETIERVIGRLRELHDQLRSAKTLIVTFGTAWVYELCDCPGYVVANCHKFPADTFRRRRLSIEEIAEEWKELVGLLHEMSPELRIIFTVSPVRHLKDGFEGNSRSKAILQMACDEICETTAGTDYFPAFEIMNDDLRDYRFYDRDLVHPSAEAVDYIWEKFQDRYLSASSRMLLKEGEKVTKRLNHRPIIYGESEIAATRAATDRQKAMDSYRAFIALHPGMLREVEGS